MLREWPKNFDENVIAVKWPRNFGLVVLLGIFAFIFSILIPGLIFLFVTGKMPEDIGLLSFVFVMFFVGLLGFACIGGFISSVKNHINPFLRFLANDEGFFMNITFKKKEAFFLRWNDILKIEKTTVKRSMSSGAVQHVDSVGIFIKESSGIVLPKVMRSVEDCTKIQINFPGDTLDGNLDEFLTQLNELREKFLH